ncbi:hypothetical protein PG994_003938 [Apiospora phragmitis]|uniref:Uncharacterized protein n=1 Tax=Apiospora phragmitis TaxID=2905665 RepID=A0ABR1VZI0_9PEZI
MPYQCDLNSTRSKQRTSTFTRDGTAYPLPPQTTAFSQSSLCASASFYCPFIVGEEAPLRRPRLHPGLPDHHQRRVQQLRDGTGAVLPAELLQGV